MKTHWLSLLLLVVRAGFEPAETRLVEPVSPSHRPINSGLARSRSPEQLLEARLGPAKLKEQEQQFSQGIQELARKLLKNKDFVQSVKKNLKPEDVERLKKQFGQPGRNGPLNDPALRGLLEEAQNAFKLEGNEKKLVEAFQGKFGKFGQPGIGTGRKSGPRPNVTAPPIGRSNPSSSTQPPSITPQPTPPSADASSWEDLAQETPDWLKKGMDRAVGDFGNWLDTPSGKSWISSLNGLAARAAEARASAPAVAPRLRTFGRYLPNVRGWLPQRSPNLPAVPRIAGRLPSAPSLPAVSAQEAGKGLLVVVMMVVVGMLLWSSRGWWKEVLAARLAAWKIGPWPVRPGEVTTRRDLVRAFEYLALLCLGPAARTCHHLELARRIGEQPVLDGERRREAARDLAGVYEQARYTPEDEPLPAELMARARRELCYLAGEPSA